MNATTERDEGFTVLDGVALVIAAAVASVHLRTPVNQAMGAGWGLVWATFAGVVLTGSGPFLFLFRRLIRRPRGYPRPGDRLWAILGLPWVLTAPFRSSPGPSTLHPSTDAYSTALTLGVAASSAAVVVILWKTWMRPHPQKKPIGPVGSSWTDRLGLALAVTWPLQTGFLLIVLDSLALVTRR